MARIRTLKPEYWTDEKMSLLDPLTRLVFLGLVSMADDAGRLIDNVKLLDGMLFPNTDDSSRDSLDTLARISRITRYVTSSGQSVIQIVNWSKHQKVDHQSKFVLPGPEEAVVVQPRVPAPVNPPLARSSRKSRESVERVSRDPRASTLDLGPRTNDLSSGAHAPANNWVDAAREILLGVGTFPHGRIGKALGPVVQQYGWPETELGLRDYVAAAKNGRSKTPEYFAQESGTWVVGAREPFADECGVPTARTDRILGVAS